MPNGDTTPKGAASTKNAPQDFKEYLLAEMRCARLRARLLQHDITAIGLALRGDLISSDQAIALLNDAGVLRLVGPSDEDESAP